TTTIPTTTTTIPTTTTTIPTTTTTIPTTTTTIPTTTTTISTTTTTTEEPIDCPLQENVGISSNDGSEGVNAQSKNECIRKCFDKRKNDPDYQSMMYYFDTSNIAYCVCNKGITLVTILPGNIKSVTSCIYA
uniref:Uncharacterized protein n=1 Tax=Clytia hemisphaerica TaxID=252671 RepID=A0A7M5VBG8_9CNID